jgi:outer membrane protein assembly factor BamE (lipoprotein component of BamABCDE complex)
MKTYTTVCVLSLFVITVFSNGCMTAQQHYEQTHGAQERQMTVGTVQKEIRKGMGADEVAVALGSPNIVTTDAEGREVWIYDKISTDVTYSRSGGGGGSYEKGAGAQSKTQRTLTVVIKFDENNKVRDFAYHTSRF